MFDRGFGIAAIGLALYYTLVTPERVSRLSRGEADGGDTETAIEQLVGATVAALQAPALEERMPVSRRSAIPLSRPKVPPERR